MYCRWKLLQLRISQTLGDTSPSFGIEVDLQLELELVSQLKDFSLKVYDVYCLFNYYFQPVSVVA